jgi:hypothetical protein
MARRSDHVYGAPNLYETARYLKAHRAEDRARTQCTHAVKVLQADGNTLRCGDEACGKVVGFVRPPRKKD